MSITIKYFSRKGYRNSVDVYFFNASKITDEEALDAYENEATFWNKSKGKLFTAKVSEDNFVSAFSAFLENAPCEAIQSFEIPDGRFMVYHDDKSETSGYAVWDKEKFHSQHRAVTSADFAASRYLEDKKIRNYFIVFDDMDKAKNIFGDAELERSETAEEYFNRMRTLPTE